MEKVVRRLNVEFGFNLSEEEILKIAKQAEEANRLFQRLHKVDVSGVQPIMKIDKSAK